MGGVRGVLSSCIYDHVVFSSIFDVIKIDKIRKNQHNRTLNSNGRQTLYINVRPAFILHQSF